MRNPIRLLRRSRDRANMARSVTPAGTSAPAYTTLLRGLAVVERRMRLEEAVQGAPWAAAGGLGLALGLALAARVTPLLPPAEVALSAAGLVLAGIALRATVAALRRRPRLVVARRADAVLALDEKVATAVALQTHHPSGVSPFLQTAQVADAAASLQAALAALPAQIPVQPARRTWVTPLLLLLLFVAALRS